MRIRKMIVALLSLCMLMMVPLHVQAAGLIDLNRNVGLTISYQDKDAVIEGAQFDIYLFATVEANGEVTAAYPFDQFNVDIRGENDDTWRTLATTLEGYILRDQIAPTDSGVTDESGLLQFPKKVEALIHGLYLVMGHSHVQDGLVYTTEPFIVSLPGLDMEKNEWIYEVTSQPKFDTCPEEKEEILSRKVIKVWDDKGNEKERPASITVQLLCDGKVHDTVTLSKENNWRYSWEELSDKHRWVVAEKEVEGYTAKVEQEGNTYIITNSYGEKPPVPDEKLPQTGQLWWPVPIMVVLGLFMIAVGIYRSKRVSDR